MLSKVLIRSEDITIEIYIFSCGQGDTVLLHLPDDKWVLVDCNLRKEDGSKKKFFDFVRSRKIERLSYVFLTHPHHDHFCGMDEVLRHFSTDGRSVGYYCDGGLNSKTVMKLLENNVGEESYGKLQEILDDLDNRGLVEYCEMDERHEDIGLAGYEDSVRLVPVAPNPGSRRRILRSELKRLARNPKLKTEANDLSIILVLVAHRNGKTFNALLAADAGRDQLERSIGVWERKEGVPEGEGRFDTVKVPHHGSLASHWSALCGRKTSNPKSGVAAISAGSSRPGLPDRQVIQDYLEHDWTVLGTSRRQVVSQKNSLYQVIYGSPQRSSEEIPSDIKISWSPSLGVTWEPLDARVGHSDLGAFSSLRK